MRIHSAATSYIDVPQSKDNLFRGGPSPVKKSKNMNRSRSITKLLSAPIRKMGKQLAKRAAMKNIGGKMSKRSLKLSHDNGEQGWINTAETFDTDESVSPRSVETLETRDSTTQSNQIHQEEEEEERSATRTLRQLLPNQYLDMKTFVHNRIELNLLSPSRNLIQGNDNPADTQREENLQGETTSSHSIPGLDVSMISDDITESESVVSPMASDIASTTSSNNCLTLTQEIASPMSSMISQQNRSSLILEEDEEIDSMAPAVDFSLYLDREHGDDDSTCVGRQSKTAKTSALLPMEIDVENNNDLSSHSIELTDHELRGQEDDIVSTTSSHNSYLRVIENITASANTKVERAVTNAFNQIRVEAPVVKDTRQKIEYDNDSRDASDDEESYCISFKPSNDLLLQAMEGASAQAKIDIERATALALSKINTTISQSFNEAAAERANLRAKKSRNRAMGFLFFLFLFLNFDGSSFLRNISSRVGIDDFQTIQGTDVVATSNSDLTLWVEKKIAPIPIQETSFEISKKYEDAHNVACVFKIGCLAFGCI
mmetsp:Transcript_24603/g.67921  ORF Transcript_24603/g.67921 Transcript_24603/m.67921 type:complete len:545 (+) Transcript_24603:85-1719(+)